MSDLVYKAALAGLLHDVGKLARLGGEQSSWAKYAHAELGDRFVQKYVPSQWRESLAPVGWHHGDWGEEERKKDFDESKLPLVKIVALADRLASGEREALEEREQRVKQLLTVFSRIRVGTTPQGPKAWFQPAPLALREDAIFPSQPLPPSQVTQAFQDLWQRFCAQAQALSQVYAQNGASIESYLESMFFVLRDHTWCAPSAYWDVEPDVSLFSHLQATSALAAVLAHDFWDQRERVDALLEAIKGDHWPKEPEVALLVVGDITGIQNFIYSLHDPKGAAAILRARSFFIQILNEVLARHILRKLGLPITCALYIGGGKFTLLLPSSAKDKLSELRARISKVVRQGIGLELVMAWAPLVPRNFQLPPKTKNGNEEIPGISLKLHEVLEQDLAHQKMRKLSDLDETELAEFFAPKGLGGKAEDSLSPTVVCNVCGREVLRTEIKAVEDVRFCRLCLELKDLGNQLKRARYLRLRAIEPQLLHTESPTLSELLKALGFALELWTDPPPAPEPSAVVWNLVEPDAHVPVERLYGPSQAAGRRFLVNFVPLVKDEKEFAEIREIFEENNRVWEVEGLGIGDVKHFGILARQVRGAPYIAVLRMDMDNLGRVFGSSPRAKDKNDERKKHEVHGLGRFATLSRITTLSFFVSLFFEGWVEKIAKEMGKDGHDRLYAVYSGGDDLCFVGSWDAVLDFAHLVRRDFARFAAREDLGVSAGIYLCHEKYPLFLAARKADEAQERAKHLRDKKDAISFLELEIGWERFEGVRERAERLISFVQGEKIPRELLRRVLELHEQYQRERDKRGEWGPWVWRAEYWLARFCERAKDEEVRIWVEEKMKAELGGEKFGENILVWALAARWAELATRR